MQISKEQVEHIAKLARLNLTEEEKEKYSNQLSSILGYMEVMNKADVSGVEPTSQVTGLTNIERDDTVHPSGIEKDLVGVAPTQADGFMSIPKIFENK